MLFQAPRRAARPARAASILRRSTESQFRTFERLESRVLFDGATDLLYSNPDSDNLIDDFLENSTQETQMPAGDPAMLTAGAADSLSVAGVATTSTATTRPPTRAPVRTPTRTPGDFLTTLIPGTGWTGSISQPGHEGTDPTAPGYNEQAVATWEATQNQEFSGILTIGVDASHSNGIARVDFAVEGGDWLPITIAEYDEATGLTRHWATLDSTLFDSNGPIEVRAIAYPTVGVPVVLESLYLTVNNSSAAPLISETFDSSAANFSVIDGTWGLVGGLYQINTPSTAATTHLNNRSVHDTAITGDFSLTVDAQAITNTTWADFGVIFGYQDPNNYYFFSQNTSNDDATHGLFRVVNGTSTQLADATLPIGAGATYQIRIDRTGGLIQAYQNNTLVASASDSTFLSGKVGFGAKNDQASFDNLSVTSEPAPQPTTVPAAPSSLVATAVSSSQINLTWADNSSDESGFKVERSTNGSTWTEIGTTGSNATSYSATGLGASTQYQFRVRAFNVVGDSAYAAPTTATTQAAPTLGAKPGAHNTGPTNPAILQPSGSITVTQDGAVIENVNVTGKIEVRANNVTIRNFRVNANGASFGIKVFSGSAMIEDGEVYNMSGAAVVGANFVARRLNVHSSGADGFNPYRNAVIEYCWIHHLGTASGSHADGVQITGGGGGSNFIIRGNFFDMPIGLSGYRSNAAIIIKSDMGPIDNVLIEKNWMNAGNYTIYSRDGGNGAPTNVRIIENRFGRDFRYGLYSIDGTVVREGNVWDDTGEPANE